MADAAVRVDIIAGRNTVVPAAQQTTQALTGLSGASRGANFAFEDLNRKGLTKLSSGFKSLAFHAAGVPGPMGKIAEGAILLGGGSGALLGVAVAAGALALAWKGLTSATAESEAAMDRLKPKLTEVQQILADVTTLQEDLAENAWWRNWIVGVAGALPFLRAWGDAVLETQAALTVSMEEGKRQAIEATNKAIVDRINLLNKQGEAEGLRILAADAAARKAKEQLDFNIATALAGDVRLAPDRGFTVPLRPFGVSEPGASPFDMMAEAEKRAFLRMEQQRADFLEMSQQFTQMLNDILLGGIVELGMALAEAIGSGRGFGSVLLEAFGGLMQRIGALLIEFGVALTGLRPLLANLFTSGPAMIAAGILISAAGAAVSKAAQGQQVSGRAATGGVSGRQYERDQQDLGARGTVTVKMQDGFIRPSDPAFQEWLAEVIRQAKGRNVVFA